MSIAIDHFIEQVSSVIAKGDNECFQKNILMMSSFVLNPIFGTSVNSGKEILIWKEIEKLVKIHFPDLLDQLKSIYLRFNQGTDIRQQNKLLNVLYIMIRYKVDHTDTISPKVFDTLVNYRRHISKSPSCNFSPSQASTMFTLTKSKSNLEQINMNLNTTRKEIGQQSSKTESKIKSNFVNIVHQDLFLVNELAFVMTGCDSNILNFDPASKGYRIDHRVVLSRSHLAILSEISQIGFLLNQINEYCDKHREEYGTIHQAFITCVTELKIKHVDYVHKIRVQVEKDKKSGAVPYWNVRKLYSCIKRNLANFCAIYRVIQLVDDNHGGALLSILFLLSYHGADNCRQLYRNIFKRSFSAFHDILLLWLNEGKLIDNHDEFFIYFNDNSNEETFWNEAFKIRHSMIPFFMPEQFVEKIAHIGKCMYFLREICHEKDLLSDHGSDIKEYFNRNQYLGNVFFSCERFLDMYKMVNTANDIASALVLKIVMGKLQIQSHFLALRRYLLLGQGDFIRRLIELLAPDLKKSYSQLQTVLNDSYLKNAIKASNAARIDDPDILNLLEFKLLPGDGNDIGWDLFSLHYSIEGPLKPVFGPNLATYETLFRFLWRIRRMDYTLSSIWKQQVIATRLLKKLPAYAYVTQQINLLRSALNHFINHIQYYFLFEVLDNIWKEFEIEIKTAKNLDEIFLIHSQTLQQIKLGLYFGSECNDILSQFLTIVNYIPDICTIQDRMMFLMNHEHDRLLEEERVAKEMSKTAKNRQMKCRSRFQKESKLDAIDVVKEREALASKLRTMSSRHLKAMQNFYKVLARSSKLGHQQLSFYIDFNDYYKSFDTTLCNASSISFETTI